MNTLKVRMMAVLAHGRRLHAKEPHRAYDNVLVALNYFYSSGRYTSEKKLQELVDDGLQGGYSTAFLVALDQGIEELQEFRAGLTAEMLEEELSRQPTLT